jgi:hypothetical protein
VVHVKRILAIVASLLSCVMLISSTSAFPPATWNEGDELAVFGHTFEEEYWTNESVQVTSEAGDNLTFSASYVNSQNVQAFMLALNNISNEDGIGTVPFQLFGMHYYTPENREIFVASILAFLMVFNDTYNGTGPGENGLPDPGNEDVSYVIPFGVASLVDPDYIPETNVMPVEKLGEGHYRFGIQYLNQYAIVTPNYIASVLFKTGWLAKFSEFSVMYEVSIDNETGEVKAETWYTIGQVTDLWLFVLGIPIPVDPSEIPSNFGLSVVHFVTVFTSNYVGADGNTTGVVLNPDITAPLDEDIVLKVGDDERAMKIGTRGTFDLIDEGTDEPVREGEDAFNAIVGVQAVDLLLVAWQLGFAAGCMSVFAYGLSDYVQANYDGPLDLATRSLLPANEDGFNAQPLWYAVSFPQWDGYRIVHDPTYTAYTNIAETGDDAQEFNAAGLIVLLLIIVAVVVVAAAIVRRRK